MVMSLWPRFFWPTLYCRDPARPRGVAALAATLILLSDRQIDEAVGIMFSGCSSVCACVRVRGLCRRHSPPGWPSTSSCCYTVVTLFDLTQHPTRVNKKLSYRRVTARCVVSVEILPNSTQQCRNYLYDKSRTNRSYEVKALQ